MSEREITHLALTVHLGEDIGDGNACTHFDFELGECRPESLPESEDDPIIGKTKKTMTADETADTLARALDRFFRKEFDVSLSEVAGRVYGD